MTHVIRSISLLDAIAMKSSEVNATMHLEESLTVVRNVARSDPADQRREFKLYVDFFISLKSWKQPRA